MSSGFGEAKTQLVVKHGFLEWGDEANAYGLELDAAQGGVCAKGRCRSLSDTAIDYGESSSRCSLASLETVASLGSPYQSALTTNDLDDISSVSSGPLPEPVSGSEHEQPIQPHDLSSARKYVSHEQRSGIDWAAVGAEFQSHACYNNVSQAPFYFCMPSQSPPCYSNVAQAPCPQKCETDLADVTLDRATQLLSSWRETSPPDLSNQAAQLLAKAEEAEACAKLAWAKAKAPWKHRPADADTDQATDAGRSQQAVPEPTDEASATAPTKTVATVPIHHIFSQPQPAPTQQMVPMQMPMQQPTQMGWICCYPQASSAMPMTPYFPMLSPPSFGACPADQQQQAEQQHEGPKSIHEFTTVMLRNVPNSYSRNMLLALLDRQGLQGCYDFVYVPMDFLSLSGLGYAFVNFTNNENAGNAMHKFQGFSRWEVTTQKVCDVSWGNPLQGLRPHIERYRNSPVMHESVPECYKPIIFKDGIRQSFPSPTKRIRPPRVKRGGLPCTLPDFSNPCVEPDFLLG